MISIHTIGLPCETQITNVKWRNRPNEVFLTGVIHIFHSSDKRLSLEEKYKVICLFMFLCILHASILKLKDDL